MIDVLVAGGGPAGLAAAIGAAMRGMEAVVVEPRPGPIDKACGEGIMPAGVRALEALGAVPAAGVPFRGIRYVDGATTAVGLFPGAPGLGVRRTALHEALLERARAAGVRIVEGRVDAVRDDGRSVEAAGLRARFLIAADGLHSPIRRALGLDAPAPSAADARFGVRRHFRIAPPAPDLVEVHWAADAEAEAYVTPVAPDAVGVALLFTGQARFEALLERFPALRARLGPAITDARGAGPFGLRARRRVCGRTLLVGDAAGFLDPITGEGVRLGLVSAAAAVRCIHEGRPAAYEAEWRALGRRCWTMAAGLLALRRTRLGRWGLVPVLRRVPRLFDAALGLLAG